VDSIPTSLGQEDHVSMGSIGALKLLRVFENVTTVLGIELLCAAQALDYREPQPGRGVVAAHRHVRERIAHTEVDHLLEREIAAAADMLRDGELLDAVEAELGELD
jgi:histidine ammonia-lyase